jgi:methylenetetrahydrofolate reductase (NADPH)
MKEFDSMVNEKTKLQQRIETGKQVVLAEISPPKSADADAVRALAKQFASHVHALGVGDNREGVRMSALAAASLINSPEVEPILHVTTRDRNRAALVADCLGAHALGIRNILCTSGTHQSLLTFKAAKNVFDIDPILLLSSLKNLGKSAGVVGEDAITGPLSFCLGGVASPFADPIGLQVPKLAQKIAVGAQFLITQPVFDLDRFTLWWTEVTKRGLQAKTAIIASVKVLTEASAAKAYAEKRPLPLVPVALLDRLASKSGADKVRAEGVKIALETIEKLSAVQGLRGFEITCDEDPAAAIEVLGSLKSIRG